VTQTEHEPEPVASDFEETIQLANAQRDRLREIARQTANNGIRNIWFVGCGGSHYAQSAAHYVLTQRGKHLATTAAPHNLAPTRLSSWARTAARLLRPWRRLTSLALLESQPCLE
jgi:fructoselysine-6-P-deglycase FrlB-like protein